jgi:hypothetical protein
VVGGCIGKPSASVFCASRFSRLLFGSGFCRVGVYDQVTEMSNSCLPVIALIIVHTILA